MLRQIVKFNDWCIRDVRGIMIAAALNPSMINPVVTVKEGKLKGALKELYDGSPYYSFKGIPYAEPPVGTLRFKAPMPLKSWQGVYDATEHGPVCPQFNFDSRKIVEGSEDCLFINVYTKTLETDSKLPVMVFIHGGGYMSGSADSNLYGPKHLLQHDIVLVTFNYRLEALGFLCLDTPEVPGNAGIKDQVAALRWVKNNVAKFGGDPNNVTLLGESAGGTAATYHMLSPMSKGLFHKAIAQSGTCLHDWAQGKDARERAFRAGKVLGKETNDSTELLQFLQSVPAVDLAALNFKTLAENEKYRGFRYHFVPVVEKKFANVDSFINKNPLKMMLANKLCKIPFMIGYNSNEGILSYLDTLKKLDIVNKNPSLLVPMEIARGVLEEKLKEIGEKIKKYYFGNEDITNEDVEAICRMKADEILIYNLHRFVHIYSAFNNPIYMYKFGCDTDLNLVKKSMKLSHLRGAAHAEDKFYLFSSDVTDNLYRKNHKLKELIWRVTKLYADFATYGNPTPDSSDGVTWTPYTRTNKDYLYIGSTLSMEQNADQDRVAFWNKIYQQTGLPCIDAAV